MSLPTLTVIGNVQKIETRQTQSGKNITTVNVSCGEKKKDGEYDNLYIKADFWEKQSDFVSQYFKEGDVIVVTGKLVTTNYMKQDGTKVYETKFQFPQASFAPKAKESAPMGKDQPAPQPDKPMPAPNMPEIDINDDEIPF
jgi:single-strand DNA-binding protein